MGWVRTCGVLLAVIGASRLAAADPLPGAEPFPAALTERIEAAARAGGAEPRTRHRGPDGRPRFSNRLLLETSPYLQQHAHNPVNWYPWGEEAFQAARALHRPIFLSIGYSTCHWCHVMEEESFEDLEIAEWLNHYFVPVKVDREERPDVDGVYMAAVQSLTGRGGWPLTVFLTPKGNPFYGGTYFPPRDGMRGRQVGLLTLLQRIGRRYQEDPGLVLTSAIQITETLRAALEPAPAVGVPGVAEIERAFEQYRSSFDAEHGGLRSRTKFPALLPIPLLLRIHRRTGDPEALRMARTTLDAMRRGGIHDHVGGGFHRYTVEPTWTVPHFEKMLYDNALLAVAFLDAYQTTQDPGYAEVVRDVLDYLERDMSAPEGTFFAATDADSEGEEGSYYVWTPAEVRAAVGDELAPLAVAAYGVTQTGNFEGGRSVLRRDASIHDLARRFGAPPKQIAERLAEIRQRLRRARAQRPPPHTDHKQIVAWNGLAISAFARAGLVLREPRYVERAARCADALLERARPEGRLARYLYQGEPHKTGLLDDHAFLIAGLLDLLEARSEPRWLEAALSLQKDLDARFFDDQGGGYYLTPSDGEALLVREKPARDGALPSGNSVEALNLLRLHQLTGDDDYRVHAEMTVRAFSEILERSPTRLARMLEAIDFLHDRSKEILIVTAESATEAAPFLEELSRVFLPNRVLLTVPEPALARLAPRVAPLRNKRALGGHTTAYVCENGVCDLPARDVATFRKQIRVQPKPYAAEPAG